MEIKELGFLIIEKLVHKDMFDRPDIGAGMSMNDLCNGVREHKASGDLFVETIKILYRDCMVDVDRFDTSPGTVVTIRPEGLDYYKAQTRVF